MLLLSNRGHTDTVYERDDLKITLKVFLSGFDLSQLHAAVDAAIYQLKIDSIEQLILSFPQSENVKLDEHKELDEEWFGKVLKTWTEVEALVDTKKVVSVGVADFELPALKALHERANLKPCVDHYNIEGCCVVSSQFFELSHITGSLSSTFHAIRIKFCQFFAQPSDKIQKTYLQTNLL